MKNLRESPEFFELASKIMARADGRSIVFSAARGNWGDGLINYGTRQFLEYYHIPYEEVHK
ncbi:hypothetical protein, partial [Nesterenkonia massiliensis]|uniref:hypothetical protein n=1 Tax=Nesterenkonia massiliensis TaxID=1232429 RepID=UPI0005CA0DC3